MSGQSLVIIVVVAVVGFIVLAIVAFVRQQQKNEERELAFSRLAAANGWQFIAEDKSYAGRFNDGQTPFRSMGGGRARNILYGSYRGRPVCIFEYSYTTSSYNGTTTTTQTHHFPIWVVGLPLAVPAFSVGSEGIFGGKVAAAMGFSRLDIGDREFDNTFKIKCENEPFGRRVLHPAVIDLLRHTGPWDWRFSGQNMISYDRGVFEPAIALPRLNLMCDLLDRVPFPELSA